MTTNEREPPSPDPLWIPPGLKFDSLPPALQKAIVEIVNRAYRELVLEAQTSLEQAMGLSFVHILWLELIEELEIGADIFRGRLELLVVGVHGFASCF